MKYLIEDDLGMKTSSEDLEEILEAQALGRLFDDSFGIMTEVGKDDEIE